MRLKTLDDIILKLPHDIKPEDTIEVQVHYLTEHEVAELLDENGNIILNDYVTLSNWNPPSGFGFLYFRLYSEGRFYRVPLSKVFRYNKKSSTSGSTNKHYCVTLETVMEFMDPEQIEEILRIIKEHESEVCKVADQIIAFDIEKEAQKRARKEAKLSTSHSSEV